MWYRYAYPPPSVTRYGGSVFLLRGTSDCVAIQLGRLIASLRCELENLEDLGIKHCSFHLMFDDKEGCSHCVQDYVMYADSLCGHQVHEAMESRVLLC